MSLMPIDVGFDLRTVGMLARIDHLPVRYDDGTPSGRLSHPEAVSAGHELAQAGYSVVIGQTPNGRDIQVTPRENAPVGDYPGYDWTGPAWAMQARNDNYWVVGPELGAVAERAGFRPDELQMTGKK